MIRAVGKHNCRNTLDAQMERVEYFKTRMAVKGLTAADAVIILANVDDPHGGVCADALMPGTDWQSIRDRGEVPFARGIVLRPVMQNSLDCLDTEAGDKLRAMEGVAVVVIDHGVVEVFAV